MRYCCMFEIMTIHMHHVFVNIGPSLAKIIPKSKYSFTQFLPDNIEDTMVLQPVTEEEIMQQVKNANNKTSKDHDQFDLCLVKKIIPYIVKPLAHICNTSLMNGIFPDWKKIARVIPLFKNGDAKEFSNCRPVSILPQFSKIVEKVFHNRLMSFINDKQILNNSQFGFRKNMYTALAIIELVEEITTAIDKGKTTLGVFIDLKKATTALKSPKQLYSAQCCLSSAETSWRSNHELALLCLSRYSNYVIHSTGNSIVYNIIATSHTECCVALCTKKEGMHDLGLSQLGPHG